MNDILLHLLATAAYAALAVLLGRHVALGAQPPQWLHAALLLPISLHAVLLWNSIFVGDVMYLGVGSTISLILWLTVSIYWVSGFLYRLEGLQIFLLPAAALLSWLPQLFPAVHPLGNAHLFAFKAHLLISLAAYSLFTIASMHVLLMAVMEKRLHSARETTFLRGMPPLLTMETLLFRIIWAGFVLLTLTLASGIFFSESLFGKPLSLNHKTVFGMLSWVIFAALLGGRVLAGWRGRVALRWTLAGFLALILAYVGSKFVLEIILHR
jgi:ABC-type uncharacterized transport system permease subunit